MSKGNGQAGSSCIICNTPPTCFHEYEIKTVENKKENVLFHYPVKHQHPVIIINRIHPEKLSDYTFTLKGQCVNGHEDCPRIVFPNEKDKFLYGNSSKNYSLEYSDKYSLTNMALLQWLEEFFCFNTKKIIPNYYPLHVRECSKLINLAALAIYPSHKMSINFTYGTEASLNKVSDKGKRHEYSDEEYDALKNSGIGDKKWSDIGKQIATTSTSCELAVEVEVGLFKEKTTLTLLEEEKKSDTNPVIKIGSFIKDIAGSLTSEKGKTKNLGPIRDLQFVSPKIEFLGKKELKLAKNEPYFEYSFSGGFNPLFGIKLIVDLVDAILSAIPITKAGAVAWREVRTALEESKKKFQNPETKAGAYIATGIDLILYGEIGGIHFKLFNDQNQEVTGEAQGGGKLDAEIRGFVEGGAKIWIIEGSVEAEVKVVTGIGGNVVVNDKGLALKWAHEGIKVKARVQLTAKAKTISTQYNMQSEPIILSEPYESEPAYFINFN